MVVAQVDSGYAVVDHHVINKQILSDSASRASVTAFASQKDLRETFKIVQVQPTTLSGDVDYAWEFIATNASGGVLVKGRNICKFDVQKVATPKPTEVDFSSRLNQVKSTFDLTNEQLAEVVGSARKTVHNWMTGLNRPNRSKAKRILELNNIASKWTSRGFSSDRDTLFLKGQSGSSLLELLSEKELDQDMVIFHGASLHIAHLGEDDLEDPFV